MDFQTFSCFDSHKPTSVPQIMMTLDIQCVDVFSPYGASTSYRDIRIISLWQKTSDMADNCLGYLP